ncbi:MAG: Disulfide bond formation protein D [Anaerolineales bacterium]|nr:Disulfide bond formation protein D [Anaerolineales bacterium]
MSRRRKSSRQQQRVDQSGITRMQIGLVAGIAVIMVVAFIVLSQTGGGQPATQAQPADSAAAGEEGSVEQGEFAGIDLSVIPSEPTEAGEPALGDSDAPVTIVEYSDYQCPHCSNFNLTVLPEVIKNYVTAGKVRHVHKNAAILGEESQWAAMAALCAADQGHFWEYNELLFEKQQGRNSGAFARENLKQYAADLGLDTETFNQCLDDNKYASKVVEETAEAKSRGVEGTPSFFVNDEFVGGSLPFEQMKEIIDKQLEAAS